LHVPAILGKNVNYTVKLELPDAISPKELGINNDKRKLALAFKKMSVKKAT
jgi:hypothetical protein